MLPTEGESTGFVIVTLRQSMAITALISRNARVRHGHTWPTPKGRQGFGFVATPGLHERCQPACGLTLSGSGKLVLLHPAVPDEEKDCGACRQVDTAEIYGMRGFEK